MQLNITILTTMLLAIGFAAGLTLPEAVDAEKRQGVLLRELLLRLRRTRLVSVWLYLHHLHHPAE
ncbi:hypothetical protein DFH06DRAFT_1340936 [Mycena polygramma]|nr:hypothetical protein DFH06DRAFT_1340936 [Mycena polygramma]